MSYPPDPVDIKIISKIEVMGELGEWHCWDIPPKASWKLRDRVARMIGYHCWCCMIYFTQNKNS